MNTPDTVLKSLNAALHRMMAADPRVVLIGEDLLDPYGGAFKVARGLSTEYPERVFSTPISEAGFTGIAAGMAMRGLRPVVEIMFGDFLMLAADQLLNHITKYPWMYDGRVEVPIVIRAPMGGRRGYGPTHSQSIEKHFLGMPGLVVVAPSPFHDPGALLERAVLGDRAPVLFVENKLMYARPLTRAAEKGQWNGMRCVVDADPYPTLTLTYDERLATADVTIVAYGGMAEIAAQAAEALLMEDETYAELVLPSRLNGGGGMKALSSSLRRTGRLLVIEEGTPTAGWGAELIARAASGCFDALVAPPRHVASRDMPIANTRTLEDAILPQTADVLAAARGLVGRAPVRLVK